MQQVLIHSPPPPPARPAARRSPSTAPLRAHARAAFSRPFAWLLRCFFSLLQVRAALARARGRPALGSGGAGLRARARGRESRALTLFFQNHLFQLADGITLPLWATGTHLRSVIMAKAKLDDVLRFSLPLDQWRDHMARNYNTRWAFLDQLPALSKFSEAFAAAQASDVMGAPDDLAMTYFTGGFFSGRVTMRDLLKESLKPGSSPWSLSEFVANASCLQVVGARNGIEWTVAGEQVLVEKHSLEDLRATSFSLRYVNHVGDLEPVDPIGDDRMDLSAEEGVFVPTAAPALPTILEQLEEFGLSYPNSFAFPERPTTSRSMVRPVGTSVIMWVTHPGAVIEELSFFPPEDRFDNIDGTRALIRMHCATACEANERAILLYGLCHGSFDSEAALPKSKLLRAGEALTKPASSSDICVAALAAVMGLWGLHQEAVISYELRFRIAKVTPKVAMSRFPCREKPSPFWTRCPFFKATRTAAPAESHSKATILEQLDQNGHCYPESFCEFSKPSEDTSMVYPVGKSVIIFVSRPSCVVQELELIPSEDKYVDADGQVALIRLECSSKYLAQTSALLIYCVAHGAMECDQKVIEKYPQLEACFEFGAVADDEQICRAVMAAVMVIWDLKPGSASLQEGMKRIAPYVAATNVPFRGPKVAFWDQCPFFKRALQFALRNDSNFQERYGNYYKLAKAAETLPKRRKTSRTVADKDPEYEPESQE